ncbi:TniB family NTP-binding protein [Novosphingobium sp. 1949]|uniref:TniB family NTP-binding protein n=1 Tax=Novosphingobium organovorum TaxID=2930092 RepID=A0ABT0BE48_9SPHN|nr:TniB family NTP-binding protein [Novosphingobium organovorum]MCJ2183320.1 TniB family NTP-binding protein [Novosphingobium organovorum]
MSGPAHFSYDHEETHSQRVERVATAKARFDAIRVDYTPQTTAVATLDEVRIAAIGRPPGAPCGGAMMVAPHGCGKTQAVEALRLRLEACAAQGDLPLLHVEIDHAGTTDSVPTSILRALGAARPEAGSEKVRWSRAIAEAERCGVQLFVFDEFNRANRRPTMSRAIATAIRQRIMDAGIAPVAFVGSEDAGDVLGSAPELMERLDDEIDLLPMRWKMKSERALFIDFVSELDTAMVKEGLMARLSGLASERVAEPLWKASEGRLRRIAKIVRHAMGAALHDGRESIHVDDLAEAVDAYCIRRQFCTYNPFKEAR